jgi:hypothetical protein
MRRKPSDGSVYGLTYWQQYVTMCHMVQQMTRIEGVSEQMWRRFRALAVERGITTPELLGSVVNGYTVRAAKRRMRIVVEPSTRRKGRQMAP